jgi:hypothetical protein
VLGRSLVQPGRTPTAKIKNPVIPTPESLTAGTGVHLTREI